MGLHARPSAMIVRLINEFPKVSITFSNGQEKADGRSIMEIMMLAASKGTTLDVVLNGDGAHSLLQKLKWLFDKGFEEI